MGESAGRIVFANQLRGLASLSVVSVHYTIVYQYMRPTIAWVISAPPVTTPLIPFAAWTGFDRFDPGAFGVALFFLISGFVIPFSLAQYTRGGFLLARALRIYPTFWAGLLIEWTVIYAAHLHWQRPIAFDAPTFLVDSLLLGTAFDLPLVDFVSWTLAIEVKFYLLMALLRPAILRRMVWPLFGWPVVAVVVNVLAARHLLALPTVLVNEAMFLCFLLPGTLFHYHCVGAIRGRALVGGVAALLALAIGCWAVGPIAGQFPSKPASYLAAAAVFSAAYAARARFRRFRPFDFLAAISYPLYLIHSLLGFSVMSWLILAWGAPYWAAACGGLGVSVLVAWTMHRTVERGSIALGRRIGRGDGGGRFMAVPAGRSAEAS